MLREIGLLIQEIPQIDQLKMQSPVQFILEYDSNLNDRLHKFENKRPWEKNLMKVYDEIDPQKLQEFSDGHLKTYFMLRESHFPRTFSFFIENIQYRLLNCFTL
jgi:hypothetical protein